MSEEDLTNYKTYISDLDITKYIVLDNESNYWYSAKYVDKMLKKQDKEIERLNNIINEAKIYCEGVIQEHENGEYDVDTVWFAVKEHKGNIKSVLNILNGDLENYWRGEKE